MKDMDREMNRGMNGEMNERWIERCTERWIEIWTVRLIGRWTHVTNQCLRVTCSWKQEKVKITGETDYIS